MKCVDIIEYELFNVDDMDLQYYIYQWSKLHIKHILSEPLGEHC